MSRRTAGLARSSATLAACLLLAACGEAKITGRLANGHDARVIVGADGGAPGADGAVDEEDAGVLRLDSGVPAPDTGVLPDAEPDAGVPPLPDGGACSGTTLASGLSLTPLAGVPAGAWAAPIPGGGVITAWRNGSVLALQRFDDSGASVGAGASVPGDGIWGLAASSDAYGLLVSRDDVLALVVIGADGVPRANQVIIGGVDHTVTNNEWFGAQLRAGRLDWTGTEWAAYSTVQRLWPDGIAHYGDQLRTFTAAGAPSSTFWDWGCSHSMDVRLAHNGATVGPVCSSDCFPEKGVLFMHQTPVYLDSSGNCMGSVAQELGGVAPMNDGFFVGFVSGEGRASKDVAIARVGNDLSVGAPRWLTDVGGDESELHLGRWGDGMIAAWISAGAGQLLALDATGAPASVVETIAADAIAGATDLFVYPGGDAGWVVNGKLARLRTCR